MRIALPIIGVLFVLFSLISLGGGVPVWMAPVPAEDMTSARQSLFETADWMIKASAGGVLGFAMSRLAVRKAQT